MGKDLIGGGWCQEKTGSEPKVPPQAEPGSILTTQLHPEALLQSTK